MLLGGSELWVYGILASWVFGCPDSWVYCNPGSSDSSAHLDLRLSVWMFAAGRMVLRVFLGSHGTLVAVSAPFMMPLRDSDIPMNVPFTFSNKQPLHQQNQPQFQYSYVQQKEQPVQYVQSQSSSMGQPAAATTQLQIPDLGSRAGWFLNPSRSISPSPSP